MISPTQHGGPDDGPPIIWDFSTNANACPALGCVEESLREADRCPYPEPTYAALRERLGHMLDVSPPRVVPSAGSSEAIRRLTLAASICGVQRVWVPAPAYADYADAARALGLAVSHVDDWPRMLGLIEIAREPALLWLCEPGSPKGDTASPTFWRRVGELCERHPQLIVAVDRAYEPLRLSGSDPMPRSVADQVWQLWSPNKALGLTGVRAGWVTAPASSVGRDGGGVPASWQRQLHARILALAPSWVMSAEGVSLLSVWPDEAVQSWLHDARASLLSWREALVEGLSRRGWRCEGAVTPFFMAHAPVDVARDMAGLRAHARARGVKWRDGDAFGLPYAVRLRAHSPEARSALFEALDTWPHASTQASSPRGAS